MLTRSVLAATLLAVTFIGISGARADGLNDLRSCGLAEQRKDFSTAIALCTRAMQSGDLSPNLAFDALADRGFAYIQKGAFPLAIQDLNAALQRKPDHPVALAWRGWAESGLKQYDAALADLDKALRLAPNLVTAYVNRGMVRRAKGDPAGAFADCGKAIALKPDYPQAYDCRAGANHDLGHDDLALQDMDRAIALNPNQPLLYFFRGELQKATGHNDRAIADFGAAIGLKSDFAGAYEDRAAAFVEIGDTKRAIADYGVAQSLRPTDPGVAMALGWLYDFNGDDAHAADTLVEARRLIPGDVYISLWLYVVRRHQHQDPLPELKAEARADVDKWPVPVLRYLLGEVSEADLLQAAQAGVVEERRDCRAAFFIGEVDLMAGKVDAARTHLKQAAAVCPYNLTEAMAAKAALKGM